MNNKTLWIIIILIVIAGLSVFFLKDKFNNSEKAKSNENNQIEKINNEKDSWNFYEDQSGFSIKYPQDISFREKSDGKYKLTIESQKIDLLDGTLGFNKETADKNYESLKNGEYGESVDMPFQNSKKVIQIDNLNAQDFVVFSRFEVCSVLFERKAYFFNNGYQILITLSIPKDKVISEFPQYFKTDKNNCSQEFIWDFEKQEEFYNLAKEGKLGIVSEWLNNFDSIIKTIKITTEQKQINNNNNLIIGKWESLDDSNSAIEFNESKKIDYYQGQKMSEDSYAINEDIIIVDSDGEKMQYQIIEVSNDKLILSYLARGNTLSYKKIK